jgi:hypothetical protein
MALRCSPTLQAADPAGDQMIPCKIAACHSFLAACCGDRRICTFARSSNKTILIL